MDNCFRVKDRHAVVITIAIGIRKEKQWSNLPTQIIDIGKIGLIKYAHSYYSGNFVVSYIELTKYSVNSILLTFRMAIG